MSDSRCMLHPLRKNHCVENDMAVEYAADMGVMLSYLKLLDDVRDDKSIKAMLGMLLFWGGVRKAKKRYPKPYAEIKSCLDRLSALEKAKCSDLDETADCFAKILEILFTPDFIECGDTKRILAWLGYNVGRWIYIIDAYNDLDGDIKKKKYNPLKYKYNGKSFDEIKTEIVDTLDLSLTLTLENASSAYDLLNIVKNKEILDNIMHHSLLMKQKSIMGEGNESL